MAKAQFIKFVGGAFLHGKDVVAYKLSGGDVRLVVETCGAKTIGRSAVVSAEKFDELQEVWTDGGKLQRGDARVTAAALKFLGC